MVPYCIAGLIPTIQFMDAHTAVWDALQALPLPVDVDTARQAGIAATLASGMNPLQFGDWFDSNADTLLGMLNNPPVMLEVA